VPVKAVTSQAEKTTTGEKEADAGAGKEGRQGPEVIQKNLTSENESGWRNSVSTK